MYLTENEKQKISQEIEKLEKESSAELVAVFTKQSSSYKFEGILISLIFTTIISLILILQEVSSVKLFQIQAISFISFYFILEKFKHILLFLLPKVYKYTKASKYANKQFINLGLQTTKTKQAIMFFVSLDEKYVEIITDSAINTRIENSYWQETIDEFLEDIQNQDISNGYLKAIKNCNKILIKEFPIRDNDENELSNDVIELQ